MLTVSLEMHELDKKLLHRLATVHTLQTTDRHTDDRSYHKRDCSVSIVGEK